VQFQLSEAEAQAAVEKFRFRTGYDSAIFKKVQEALVGLGPVNTCVVVATEAIFSQDKAARVPCSYSTQTSANAGLRENGPVPSGCA